LETQQNMKTHLNFAAAVAAVALAAALAGCQREGPAESAGKKVDRAIDKTGQSIERAGDKIRDAAKNDKK
jgi:predicted small lipoprotein YifL